MTSRNPIEFLGKNVKVQGVEYLTPKILDMIPHDRNACTQGLAWKDGLLYESSGLYGKSKLQEMDARTGEVLRQVILQPEFFAEGLAIISNTLVQMTWKEQIAFKYDIDTLSCIASFSYSGEGWGLCTDNKLFYMSNGTDKVDICDINTFFPANCIHIKFGNEAVDRINDLECVGESLFANIWLTDTIVRIRKTTGEITGIIDASVLLSPEERSEVGFDSVLNGITYNYKDETFFITGKFWPWIYRVQFMLKENL